MFFWVRILLSCILPYHLVNKLHEFLLRIWEIAKVKIGKERHESGIQIPKHVFKVTYQQELDNTISLLPPPTRRVGEYISKQFVLKVRYGKLYRQSDLIFFALHSLRCYWRRRWINPFHHWPPNAQSLLFFFFSFFSIEFFNCIKQRKFSISEATV